jgi:hypothetical protein
MKKKLFAFVFLLLLLFDAEQLSAQIANAGPDQQIYLSQTSTVVLDGSKSSGVRFKWTDISTDYKCPGRILSPGEKITKVTGLQQGVFYFRLAASKGSSTVYDTVTVSVDLTEAPATAMLVDELPIAQIAPDVNNRIDTVHYLGYHSPNNFSTRYHHIIYLERSRLPGMHVDKETGKFYSTIEDGYEWNNSGYARSECTFGGSLPLDTSKTYLFKWKGYFRQKKFYINEHGVNWANIVCIFQIHANNAQSPPLAFSLGTKGNIFVGDLLQNGKFDSLTIGNYDDFVNKAHTISVTLKEGNGTGSFIEVSVDGVLKYLRNKGPVGGTFQEDYVKFGGLYDWHKWIADPHNKSRNRKFSLVTESFQIFELR